MFPEEVQRASAVEPADADDRRNRAAADLPRIEQVCLSAYLEGLRVEGCDLGLDVVRRAHAVQLMLFTGLSALPFELLEAQPTPELRRVAAERAAIARFSLDLLADTTRTH